MKDNTKRLTKNEALTVLRNSLIDYYVSANSGESSCMKTQELYDTAVNTFSAYYVDYILNNWLDDIQVNEMDILYMLEIEKNEGGEGLLDAVLTSILQGGDNEC